MKNFIPIEAVMKFVENVKHANTIRLCPVCNGTGEFDTPSNMGPGVPKCWVCKGTGGVDMASTCCCGMPAVFFKDEMVYCGRDACLASMKHKRAGAMC